MRATLKGLFVILFPVFAFGQSWNTWQGFHPSRNNAVGRAGLPQAGLIVSQIDLVGSVSPQVGSATFARSGSVIYGSSNSLLSTAGSGIASLPAVLFGGTNIKSGLQLVGPAVNRLLRSDDFNNAAWTKIATAATTADTATDMFGNSVADTISGSATGDGVTQSLGVAAASTPFQCSIYAKSTAGTPSFKIRIRDNTTSEKNETTCRTSTSYGKPCKVYKSFSAAASGNAAFDIIVDNQSTLRFGGASCGELTSVSTLGDNSQWGGRPYIPTAAAAVTTTGDSLYIPSATVSPAIAKGTMCFWHMPFMEVTEMPVGGGHYPVSMNNEDLAIINAVSAGGASSIRFFYGNTLAADPGGQYYMSVDRWSHVCARWDQAAPSWKLSLNGVTIKSSVGAIAAPSASDMYLSGYPAGTARYAADGITSKFVMWKTTLTDTEISQIYNSQYLDYQTSDPGTGKIFSADLGTSLVPTTAGDYRYYYDRPGTSYYYDSTTTFATASDNNPIFGGRPLNGFNKGGLQNTMNATNYLLRSEDPANAAWTNVGAATLTSSVGTWGSVAYGTIVSGGSGIGIRQVAAGPIAAANQRGAAYVYAQTGSGTLAFNIVVEGDSGGTPTTTTCSKTATTTMDRYECLFVGLAGTTGNIRVSYLNQAAGTLRVGAMGFNKVLSSQTDCFGDAGCMYVKTLGTTASSSSSYLRYQGYGNINPKKGTLLAWVNSAEVDTQWGVGQGFTIFGVNGHWTYGLYLQILQNGELKLSYNGTTPAATGTISVTKNQWFQVGAEWDCTTNPGTFTVIKDGAQVATATGNYGCAQTGTLWLGQDDRGWPTDAINGLLDRYDIWGSQQGSSSWSTEYNNIKATYGR